MDFKIFIATFLTIFLAELGDKTQLAVITLSGGTPSRISVFLGAALALALVTLIGVIVGSGLAHLINPRIIKLGGGVLFIVFGVFLLLDKL